MCHLLTLGSHSSDLHYQVARWLCLHHQQPRNSLRMTVQCGWASFTEDQSHKVSKARLWNWKAWILLVDPCCAVRCLCVCVCVLCCWGMIFQAGIHLIIHIFFIVCGIVSIFFPRWIMLLYSNAVSSKVLAFFPQPTQNKLHKLHPHSIDIWFIDIYVTDISVRQILPTDISLSIKYID